MNSTTFERAIVILHDPRRDPGEMVAVSGINLQRHAHEAALLFVARLDAHVRSRMEKKAMPFVCFAVYGDDPE